MLTVGQLWRFPVKSMGGESLDEVEVGSLGLDGDRSWGVVDRATGNVLTARREPRLLLATAALVDGDLVVTLPDGRLTDAGEDVAAWLDRDVELRPAGPVGGTYENPLDPETESGWVSWQGPPGAWHDSHRTRVSLVSTGTVGEWDVRRFRANVVLEGEGEDALVGRRIELGEVTLDVTKQIDRCVMVTREQPGLPADRSVLRTIARQRANHLGIGALVVTPGRLTVGTPLS